MWTEYDPLAGLTGSFLVLTPRNSGGYRYTAVTAIIDTGQLLSTVSDRLVREAGLRVEYPSFVHKDQITTDLVAVLGRDDNNGSFFGRLFEDATLYVSPLTRNQLTVGLDIISQGRLAVDGRYCEFNAPNLPKVDVTYGPETQVVVRGGNNWS